MKPLASYREFERLPSGHSPDVAEHRRQTTAIPLAQLPSDVSDAVGDAGVKQVNLYRSLKERDRDLPKPSSITSLDGTGA